MLVKILSYTASVLGTARYKAVLLSCLVLIISVASVGGVALWHDGARKAASKLEESQTQSEAQQGSLQLGGSQKQAIQNSSSEPAPQSSQQTAGTAQSSEPSAPKPPTPEPQPKPEIALSVAKLSIAQGAASEHITAATNGQGSSTLAWEVVVAGVNPGLQIEQENTTGASMRFTVRAKQDIDKNNTYEVLVQLRDTAQNTIVTSKTVTVTIL